MHLGQRLMHQTHILEQRRPLPKRDRVRRAEVEMVILAALNIGAHVGAIFTLWRALGLGFALRAACRCAGWALRCAASAARGDALRGFRCAG
jgi:hypothetical protein